jgi:hypothetical protein
MNRRVIREVRTGTATFKASLGTMGIIDKSYETEGYLTYTAAEAPADNDQDGMADDWELKNGLNPNNPNDRNLYTADGYTALEVYLNSLMGEYITPVFITGVKDPELKQVSVYPTNVVDQLTISSGLPLVTAVIYTVEGKKVASYNIKEDRVINLSGLSSGSYIVKVRGANDLAENFRIFKK